MVRLTATLLITLSAPTIGIAALRSQCLYDYKGYVIPVDEAPFRGGDFYPATDGLWLENDGNVELDGVCPPTAGRVRTNRRGETRIVVRWSQCPGVVGRVTMKATMDAQCVTLIGEIHAPRHRVKHRPFTGYASYCGDGIIWYRLGGNCDPGDFDARCPSPLVCDFDACQCRVP
mgnify:CR=1 FL=1